MVVLIHRARVAGVAPATGALGHPTAHWLPTTVIAIDLVNRINRATAPQVAYHSTIATMISLGFGGDRKSKNGED